MYIRDKIHLLNSCGSAFQGAKVIWSINWNGDEWVIVLIIKQTSNNFVRTNIQKTYPLICICSYNNQEGISSFFQEKPNRNATYMSVYFLFLPRLKAAHTPECARAKRMSCAATISITFVLFIKNGNTGKPCPLGSWVSYSSWSINQSNYTRKTYMHTHVTVMHGVADFLTGKSHQGGFLLTHQNKLNENMQKFKHSISLIELIKSDLFSLSCMSPTT